MTNMVPCVLNGEYKIILPEHRANRPEWYTEEGWEKKRLKKLHQVISSKDMVYYIGTEEGDMAALCAVFGAKMFLVEPNDRVWSNVKAIWEANNLPAPLTFSGFASTKTTPDAPIFHGFPESANGPIISDHGFKELRDPHGIPEARIDDIAKLLTPPTVISLDVEGSEWDVLHGAEETLKKYHPKIFLSLHPEFLLTQYNHWGAELRKWLCDLGYKETLIDYPLHEVHLYYEQSN